MTHEFLPSVEESYHRLLEHIPGMAYRCRVERPGEASRALNMCWNL